MQPLMIFGFIAVAVVIGICGYIASLKRREAMVALANRLGLRFSPHKDRGPARQYHFLNAKANLSLSQEELLASGKNKVVSTSAKQVIEEYLRNNQNTSSRLSGRMIYMK